MRNRSSQNSSTLSTRGSTNKTVIATERSRAEKPSTRSDNTVLRTKRSTSYSKKDKISRPIPKTEVTQNRKATPKVNRSGKPVGRKGESYADRLNQNEVKSKANKTRTSHKDFVSKSRKPVYAKKSPYGTSVSSKSRSNQSGKPKINNTQKSSNSNKFSIIQHDRLLLNLQTTCTGLGL
jgi:hypothetical protein